jgi:hypothetical protein
MLSGMLTVSPRTLGSTGLEECCQWEVGSEVQHVEAGALEHVCGEAEAEHMLLALNRCHDNPFAPVRPAVERPPEHAGGDPLTDLRRQMFVGDRNHVALPQLPDRLHRGIDQLTVDRGDVGARVQRLVSDSQRELGLTLPERLQVTLSQLAVQ